MNSLAMKITLSRTHSQFYDTLYMYIHGFVWRYKRVVRSHFGLVFSLTLEQRVYDIIVLKLVDFMTLHEARSTRHEAVDVSE